jgi:hypothetical protein
MFSSVSGILDFCFNISFGCGKVDLDVAYVAMTKYACCKPMLQLF